MRDLLRRARIDDAGGHAFGDAKTLLDLAQNQHAGVRASDDNNPPSNWATIFLAPTGDKPGSGSIGLVMAGVAFLKSR